MKSFTPTFEQKLDIEKEFEKAASVAAKKLQEIIDADIVAEIYKQSKPSRRSGKRHDRPILNRKPK